MIKLLFFVLLISLIYSHDSDEDSDELQPIRKGQWLWNANKQKWEEKEKALPLTPRPLTETEIRLREVYGIPGNRTANQKLRVCCRGQEDADLDCRRRFCDFYALSPQNLVPFVSQCIQKGRTISRMYDCASSRADHRRCCRREGVAHECLSICDATGGPPTNSAQGAKCLVYFDQIRGCFEKYLEKHPNIKGDF